MIAHPHRNRKRPEAASNAPLTGFGIIKHAVAQQFAHMTAHDLFRTGADKDDMWTTYLASFPDGTNPMFRQRTEHDCSCCRQFIRAVGDVVAIIDGRLTSIWDIETDSATYLPVADAMSRLVRGRPIDNHFLHYEAEIGTDRNFEDAVGGVRSWEHFFINLPNSRVCTKADIGPRLSESRALHDVLLRSLTELTPDAIDTVLELIGQSLLYRGEEHRHAVSTFKATKAAFDHLPALVRDNFVWSQIGSLPGSVSKIRNTSIGTLLTDLSEGRDMEGAVKSFEAMVAPANYKRPTALVTKAMIERAKATVEELGLTTALERRYATLADITVNNILYVDRSARKALGGSVFDELADAVAVKPKSVDRAEEVGIDKFLADVLPEATSIEVLVENRHAGNLVSLIAPTHPAARPLFKWDNRFSWSYAGDVADSIRERVKKAGGNVSGDLCCRLAWFNFDDLDFHMFEPNGRAIYFGFKGPSLSGGMLDVDMNVGSEQTREPVENIYYPAAARMLEGAYLLFVHQYNKREATNAGFEAEIDFKGTIYRFAYDKPLRQGERIVVAILQYTKASGVKIVNSLPFSALSKKVWNIDTETFRKVNVVMMSPNHWDGHGVGNRHYFFMLDGCQNDGTARGFYNEFLKGELDPHRKVLEMVGNKMRTDESANQLSGLGFSSTQRNHAVVRLNGARTIRVNL